MNATAMPLNEVQLLREENAQLRTQIAWLKKQLFGPGKSETLDRAQLLLTLGELEKLAAAKPFVETITYERAKGPAVPRPLPAENFAHLPVKETVVIEPAAVQADPTLYEKIGEERTFEVDVTPPQLYKREIVRPKYRHRLDRTRAPLVAPAPARPVAGGYASAGLLAWVLIAKYCDHLPLYRQEKMLARWGAKISSQTMTDWVRISAEWLEPLYKRMQHDLLAGGYVQADETPIRCNDPDEKRGGTTQGWLWAISKPGGDVVFDWRLTRQHGELTSLLKDYRGILQSDGYGAYPAFARDHAGVAWVGCWAHARRKFFEALGNSPKAAQWVLRLIGRLYELERQWDEANVGERRAALRTAQFARPLYWLKCVVLRMQAQALPQSPLGQACTYLLNQWAPLTAHLNHSQTRLDNNLIENAIRPSAIGKKNWLFIGHPEAGQRSAIIYSLVGSCQRHGKDPLAYLRHVLTRLPAMTTRDDLAPLLPANWSAPAQLS
ncbi:MAG TPA: IS66 family transposase [Candidatus Didemnitutus sp.]|jgi:transposase